MRNEKVVYLEFKGPVTAAVGFSVYIFQFLILFVIALIINKLSIIIFVLLLPFMSYFAFIYLDVKQKYRACKRLNAENMEYSDIPNPFGTEWALSLKNEREVILKIVRENQKSKVS